MGLRFRKSVKICKGVKVNFSKSGASLSIGGRGHSLNFGGQGTRATVGIPGTGLSYSTKLSGNQKKKSSSNRVASSKAGTTSGIDMPSQVQLKMSSDGRIEILDNSGLPITDPSMIRKIKSINFFFHFNKF